MIDVREAIQKALAFAEQIYASKLDDPRVEEVDSTGIHWLITLSFSLPRVETNSALRNAIIGTSLERQYKIFKVNKSDGAVSSMKIRELGTKRWSS
jgi:hypothetical protein